MSFRATARNDALTGWASASEQCGRALDARLPIDLIHTKEHWEHELNPT